MTTIAWDGETLAADSQEQDDCIEQHACRKIFRVGNTLVGMCGETAAGLLMLKWIREGEISGEAPKVRDDVGVLVIRPNGKAFEYGATCVPIPCGRITAMGSGRVAALGAMLAGADAVDAVRIARRLDPYTGGPVRSLRLRRS